MSHTGRRLTLILATAVLAGAMATGCVRRTVTINTAPQGAVVYLNDREIGTTPASVDFTWYGDYDVVVRKDGYKTLKTNHRLEAPWYDLPPVDFIAEALWPLTIHDQREMYFELEPRPEGDRQELIESAEDFRDRTLFGGEGAE